MVSDSGLEATLFQNNYTLHGYGLDGLCQRMTAKKDNIEMISDVYFWATNEGNIYDNITSLNNDYASSIAPFVKTTVNLTDPAERDGYSALRGWMWLSCGMALGWLQTTDNTRSMFGHLIPLEFVFPSKIHVSSFYFSVLP